MSDTLTELVNATIAADKAAERRDALIVRAREEGHPLRAIADAAGVAHQTVVNVVSRHAARS